MLGNSAENQPPAPLPSKTDGQYERHCEAYNSFKQRRYLDSLSIFTELSDNGSALAPAYVGMIYSRGLDVEVDDVKALWYFDLSSKRGCNYGTLWAGELLRDQNKITECVEYYKRGLMRGSAACSYRMYFLYANGRLSISKENADKYLLFASKAGHVYARREIILKMRKGECGIIARLRAIPLLLKVLYDTTSLISRDPANELLM